MSASIFGVLGGQNTFPKVSLFLNIDYSEGQLNRCWMPRPIITKLKIWFKKNDFLNFPCIIIVNLKMQGLIKKKRLKAEGKALNTLSA